MRRLLKNSAIGLGLGIGIVAAVRIPESITSDTVPDAEKFPALAISYSTSANRIFTASAPTRKEAEAKSLEECGKNTSGRDATCFYLDSIPEDKPACIAYGWLEPKHRFASVVRERRTIDRFAGEKPKCLTKPNADLLSSDVCRIGNVRYACNNTAMEEETAAWGTEDAVVTRALATELAAAREGTRSLTEPAPQKLARAEQSLKRSLYHFFDGSASLTPNAATLSVPPEKDMYRVVTYAPVYDGTGADARLLGHIDVESCVGKASGAASETFTAVAAFDRLGNDLSGYVNTMQIRPDKKATVLACTASFRGP